MKNRIGIIGGGQLGKMLTLEAKKLGFTVVVVDPTHKSPAAQVADEHIFADFDDTKAIELLGQTVDYLTFEIELANAEVLQKLMKKGITINPSPKSLEMIKDKFGQKEFFKKLGVKTPRFKSVSTKEDIKASAQTFGYPLMLKARFNGYDGRGNTLLSSDTDIDNLDDSQIQEDSHYVEAFIDFEKELAVMAARDINGNIKLYPLVETIHKESILHEVIAPAQVPNTIVKKAQKFVSTIMEHLHGAGVFGIEMFLGKDNEIYMNEIAPRVHNSGHYTSEACVTSQFEQHIRAITGLPLGDTSMKTTCAVMINILGERNAPAKVQGLSEALAIPSVTVHIYGKHDTKVKRKMGHITAIGDSLPSTRRNATKAREFITI